jgi:hypothetical protein
VSSSPRDNHIAAVGLASLEVEEVQSQAFDLQEKARNEVATAVSNAVGTSPGSGHGQAAARNMAKIPTLLAEVVNQCELVKQSLAKYSRGNL